MPLFVSSNATAFLTYPFGRDRSSPGSSLSWPLSYVLKAPLLYFALLGLYREGGFFVSASLSLSTGTGSERVGNMRTVSFSARASAPFIAVWSQVSREV